MYSVGMSRNALPFLALLLASTAGQASNCESIRDQIDAKIRAAGVASFTLNIVDAGATAPGRNLGSCDRGSKKIMYIVAGSADAGASAPAKPHKRGPDGVLTECKDGTVSLGGPCPK